MERKPPGYWTKEHCKEEAMKYTTRKDFEKECGSAYRVSSDNKWLDEFFGKRTIKWSRESCFNEAKKYKYASEFRRGSGGAFSAAFKKGWIKDYTWFINGNHVAAEAKRIWKYDSCMELAKLCHSIAEFKRRSNVAYNVARQNGWLTDYTWFESGFKLHYENNAMWTHDACLVESKKYSSRTEFCRKAVGAYTASIKHNWIDEFSWLRNDKFDLIRDKVDSVYAYIFESENAVYVGRTLMRCQRNRDCDHIINISDTVAKFAKEKNIPVPKMLILEENLTIEEGSFQEGVWLNYFKKQGYNILNKCRTGGIGAIGRGKWNQETCLIEAQKYSSLLDFYTKSKTAYKVANENGWLKDYHWLKRLHKERIFWTDELCREESKKYTSLTEFCKLCSGGYKYASTHHLLNSFSWLQSEKMRRKQPRQIDESLQLLIWE